MGAATHIMAATIRVAALLLFSACVCNGASMRAAVGLKATPAGDFSQIALHSVPIPECCADTQVLVRAKASRCHLDLLFNHLDSPVLQRQPRGLEDHGGFRRRLRLPNHISPHSRLRLCGGGHSIRYKVVLEARRSGVGDEYWRVCRIRGFGVLSAGP